MKKNEREVPILTGHDKAALLFGWGLNTVVVTIVLFAAANFTV